MQRIASLPSRLLTGLLLMSGPAIAIEPTQLELRAIFASSDATRSTALVSIKGQAPLAARIDQPLPEGFSLEAIAHDQVLVAYGNQRFRLMLQGHTSGTEASAPAPEQASVVIPATEPASGAYTDVCQAIAGFDPAQREELQSLGICAR